MTEIGNMIEKFMSKEIAPHINKFESKDYEFMVKKLKQAGELGFLGMGVPTEYGGLGLNFNTSTYLGVKLSSVCAEFSTAQGVH